MRRRDRDPAGLLFRRSVDLVIGTEFAASTVVIAAVSVVLPWST